MEDSDDGAFFVFPGFLINPVIHKIDLIDSINHIKNHHPTRARSRLYNASTNIDELLSIYELEML